MYKLTKNIKQTSVVLILIGLVSLGIGFYQSLSVLSDEEIKISIKAIAKELELEYDTDYDKGDKVSLDKNVDYTELIHRVEKELHCHIDAGHVHSVKDVIYAAKHYFHAKHQRPWSSLLISTLFYVFSIKFRFNRSPIGSTETT